MTVPTRPRTVWQPLRTSLAVVAFLATVGSFGVGFGVLTDCTNAYRCTVTACAPCAPANAWLTAGWIGQGVLLLVGAVLAVLAARRVALDRVHIAALLLGPLGVALLLATWTMATRSY